MAQGLQSLTGAVGQLGAAAIQMQEREELRAAQQAKIDQTNKIINDALNLNDKLIAAGKTPFVIQRDVFRYISSEEAKAGLQTGSAMSSYKQFFQGTMAGEEGTANEIQKWKGATTTKLDTGLMYTIAATGEQKFIPYPEQVMLAEEAANQKKVDGKWIRDQILIHSPNLVNDPKIQTAMSSGNIPLALENPKFNSLMQMQANAKSMETQLDLMNSTQGVSKQAKSNVFRQAGVVEMLTDAANDIISQDISLVEAERKFQQKIMALQGQNPEEFSMAVGTYPESLMKHIRTSHKETAQKEQTVLVKDKAENQRALNAFYKEMARTTRFESDYSTVLTEIQIDALKGVDFQILQNMKSLYGGTWEDIMKSLVGLRQGERSIQNFEQRLSREYSDGSTAATEIGEGAFVPAEDGTVSQSAQYVLDLIVEEDQLNRLGQGNHIITQAKIAGIQKDKKKIAEELMKSVNLVEQNRMSTNRRTLITNFIRNYLTD